jgi:hypothetical protein
MIYIFYMTYKYFVRQAGSKHIDKVDKVGCTRGPRRGDYEQFWDITPRSLVKINFGCVYI